jgi:hypothetical protein
MQEQNGESINQPEQAVVQEQPIYNQPISA